MKNEVKSLKIKNILFNIIITILLIALIIAFSIMLHSVRTRRYTVEYNLRQISRYVEAENFGSLVDAWQNNLKCGITEETNPEFAAVYAVAEYYYLLPEYRIYLNQRYTEKSKEIAEILSEDRVKMAELEILADEFDALYGLK